MTLWEGERQLGRSLALPLFFNRLNWQDVYTGGLALPRVQVDENKKIHRLGNRWILKFFEKRSFDLFRIRLRRFLLFFGGSGRR